MSTHSHTSSTVTSKALPPSSTVTSKALPPSGSGSSSGLSSINTAINSEREASLSAEVQSLSMTTGSTPFSDRMFQHQGTLSSDAHPQSSTTSIRTAPSAFAGSKQDKIDDRNVETIIHFPENVPTLSLVSFTPPLSSSSSPSNNVSSHGNFGGNSDHLEGDAPQIYYDTEDEGPSIRPRLSWRALRQALLPSRVSRPEPMPHRRWSKDSNKTLTNDLTVRSRQRENLRQPSTTGYDETKLRQSTPTTSDSTASRSVSHTLRAQTALRRHLDIPRQLSVKVVDRAIETDPHNRSHPLFLSELSPMCATPPGVTPTGKRYVDPGMDKKARKALKAAIKKNTILFSNERTFIHWIKFGMLLGALAMTLLNFAGDNNVHKEIDQILAERAGRIGKNVGVGLMVICLVCLLYASSIFHWRHVGVVRSKSDSRYFDRIGPTLLTLALVATYSTNVFLTIQVTSNMNPNYTPSVFFNSEHQNTSAPAPPPIYSPPVFDTPPLHPGSTILVDDNDEDEDESFSDDYESSSSNRATAASVSQSRDSSRVQESQAKGASLASFGRRPMAAAQSKPLTAFASTEEDDQETES